MSVVIGTVEYDFSMMILSNEESELVLDLYENTQDFEHVAGVLFLHKPSETLVSLDRKIYNDYQQKKRSG